MCVCVSWVHTELFLTVFFFIKQIFLGASMQSIKVFSPKNDWMPKHIFSLYFIYNLKDAKLVTEQSSASYLCAAVTAKYSILTKEIIKFRDCN